MARQEREDSHINQLSEGIPGFEVGQRYIRVTARCDSVGRLRAVDVVDLDGGGQRAEELTAGGAVHQWEVSAGTRQ